MPRDRHTQMPKTANPLHGDQVSTAQAGVAKSVVSRNARAEERSSFCGCEIVRNRRERTCFSDHYFRIPSIRGDARHHGILAIHDVSAPARFTDPVFSSNQADANSFTGFPSIHSAAHPANAPNHFMSSHAP